MFPQNHNISWLQVLWDITPGPQWSKYLTVRGILHQIHNIPGLQNLWDVSQKQQYLMVVDFLRYNTSTTVFLSFCLFFVFLSLDFFIFLNFYISVFLSFCLFIFCLLSFCFFCLLVFLSFCLFVQTSLWSNVWRVSTLKSQNSLFVPKFQSNKVAVTDSLTDQGQV